MFELMLSIVYESWLIIQSSAPFILFGFLAAGFIHTFISTGRIIALLGKKNFKSVLIASICGVPLPLCSCSTLPTAAVFRKKGASRGATTSFLISTPATGVDSIFFTFGLLNLTMAIIRPIAAFITALAAGVMVNIWGDDESVSIHSSTEEDNPSVEVESVEDARPWWRKTLNYGFTELMNDLAFWLLTGFIISGCITVFIPDWVFQGWAGQGFTSLLVMLIIGTPMYMCASGSIPIAAAMMAKGLSPGAVIVFLLAGPATNFGSIPIISKLLGRRSTVIYLVSIITFSLLIGFLVNLYIPQLSIVPEYETTVNATEQPSLFSALCGCALIFLLIRGIWSNPPAIDCMKISDGFTQITGMRPSWNKALLIIVGIGLTCWLQMCFFIVGPGETGIITRLGKPVATELGPGLYIHFPPPISRSYTVKTDEIKLVQAGKRLEDAVGNLIQTDEESRFQAEFLTGDENILDITFLAEFSIKNAYEYTFGISDSIGIIRQAINAALTKTLAVMKIDTVFTTARRDIEKQAYELTSVLIEKAMPGVIDLKKVRLIRIHAPANLHFAFRDVASAEEDRETKKNEALVDKEMKIHYARGEAQQIMELAHSEKYSLIQKAVGNTAMFSALSKSDLKWPEETRLRMRFETNEKSLKNLSKIITPISSKWPELHLMLWDKGLTSLRGKEQDTENSQNYSDKEME